MQNRYVHVGSCADLEGGRGASGPPPLKFANLIIPDITGNEKLSCFSYL